MQLWEKNHAMSVHCNDYIVDYIFNIHTNK